MRNMRRDYLVTWKFAHDDGTDRRHFHTDKVSATTATRALAIVRADIADEYADRIDIMLVETDLREGF